MRLQCIWGAGYCEVKEFPTDFSEAEPSDIHILHQFVAKTPESKAHNQCDSKKSHLWYYGGVRGAMVLWGQGGSPTDFSETVPSESRVSSTCRNWP